VLLSNGTEFLADKIDLHFIEAHIWFSSYDYASCKQNGKIIWLHNLILGHNLTSNLTINHINQNQLDNRRSNLRIATQQTQMINCAPQNGTNQPGVYSNKNYWFANWIDHHGIKKSVWFSINKLGFEVAKQLGFTQLAAP